MRRSLYAVDFTPTRARSYQSDATRACRPDIMVNLRCFGTLAVSGDGEFGTSSGQPRRLALMAVLAVNHERGTSRDSLLALLWPESDTARARQALSQALYAVRRDLRESSLVEGTRLLRLNDNAIMTDIQRFRRALKSGNDELAVASYGGDFLDGVHVGAGESFERWADDQRASFARQYRDALDRLARASDQQGDYKVSREWLQRLCEADPLSSRVAAQLARAFARSGDRAAALTLLRDHVTRVRSELEVEPDALIASARAEIQSASSEHYSAHEDSARIGLRPRETNRAAAIAAPAGADAEQTRSSESGESVPQRRNRMWLVIMVPIVAIALASIFLRSHARALTPSTDISTAITRIEVVPFEFVGASSDAFKARAVERFLVGTLSSIPALEVRASEPALAGTTRLSRAEHSGALAPRVLSGTVISTPDGRTLTASAEIRDSNGVAVIRVRASSANGDLGVLTDDLARALIGQLGIGDAQNGLLRAASATTRSVDALKAFVTGEDLFASGHWKEAQDAFSAAVRSDSTFALAHYRLSEAANWNGDGATQTRSARHAWRLREGLLPRERLLVEAYYTWNRGDIDGAESLYRDAATRYPRDAEAWYQLGEVLFHSGPVAGRTLQQAIAPYEHVVALTAGTVGGRREESLLHLARIAGASADLVAFDTLLRTLRARPPSSDVLELNTLAACVRQRAEDVALMQHDLATANGHALVVTAQRCTVYGSSLAQALGLYAAIPRTALLDAAFRVAAIVERASLLTAIGDRRRAAWSLSAAGAGSDAPSLLLHRAILAWGDPVSTKLALRALRDSLDAGLPRTSPSGLPNDAADFGLVSSRFAPWLAGLLSLRIGDTSGVSREISMLRSAGGDSTARDGSSNMAHSLLAHFSLFLGDPTGALAQLDSMRPIPFVPLLEYAIYRAPERIARARALLLLGRAEESATVALSVGQRHSFEYSFVPEASTIAVRALTVAGRPDSAAHVAARLRKRGVIFQ